VWRGLEGAPLHREPSLRGLADEYRVRLSPPPGILHPGGAAGEDGVLAPNGGGLGAPTPFGLLLQLLLGINRDGGAHVKDRGDGLTGIPAGVAAPPDGGLEVRSPHLRGDDPHHLTVHQPDRVAVAGVVEIYVVAGAQLGTPRNGDVDLDLRGKPHQILAEFFPPTLAEGGQRNEGKENNQAAQHGGHLLSFYFNRNYLYYIKYIKISQY